MRCEFKRTNNSEHEALVVGLILAQYLKVDYLIARSDSLLVVNQVKGTFLTRYPWMIKYSTIMRSEMRKFKRVELKYIPRERKGQTDDLANFVASTPRLDLTILFSSITNLTIDDDHNNVLPIAEHDWRKSVLDYLNNDTLLKDKKDADREKKKVAEHVVISAKLYKRSLNIPLLR